MKKNRTIRMTDEEYELFKRIDGREASRGVLIALKYYRENNVIKKLPVDKLK